MFGHHVQILNKEDKSECYFNKAMSSESGNLQILIAS